MHPCNVPSTGDGVKTEIGDADFVSMCKRSREPVTVDNLLETSYV